jgi:Tfp pilus assembly protein PilO
MSETPITVERAVDWAEKFKSLVAPLLVAGVIAIGLYFTIDHNLSRVIESSKVHEIRIEELRKGHQEHEKELTDVRANQRSMVKEMEDKFESLSKQLDQVNASLTRLLERSMGGAK